MSTPGALLEDSPPAANSVDSFASPAPAPGARALATHTAAGVPAGAPAVSVPGAAANPAAQSRIFRGRTIEELIPRIQDELGADAIVLRRRTGLTGGIGGFFQRQFAEIEAQPGGPSIDLYDENPDTPIMPPPMAPAQAQAPTALSGGPQHQAGGQPVAVAGYARGIARPGGAYVSDSLAALANSGMEPEQPQSLQPQPKSESFTDALAAAEIAMFEPLDVELERIQPEPREPEAGGPEVRRPEVRMPEVREPEPHGPEASGPVPQADDFIASPPPRTPAPRSRTHLSIESDLLGLGMSEEFIGELIDSAAAHVLPLFPRLSLARAVHRGLIQSIPVRAPLPAASASIAVVGSGGSGKTSCCAGLLAAYRKGSTLPASCATIVADGEPNEHSLLLSPLVMSPTPLSSAAAGRALAGAREQGLLLLDTPPLSPSDRPAIRALTSVMGDLRPDRIVVALPATLSAKAAAQLLDALSPLGASAVAITHADETDQLGVAVEAACRFGLAPEYLADRSRARGRLVRIDPAYLADKLLP